MCNPDFVKLAEAYRIPAQKVDKREDVAAALDQMLQHNGSYFLEIVVEKEENVFPMVASGASISDIRLE